MNSPERERRDDTNMLINTDWRNFVPDRCTPTGNSSSVNYFLSFFSNRKPV